MTATGRKRFWTPRAIVIALGMAGIFVAANAHMIAASLGAQPECVPHLKSEIQGAAGFRAASPSC